MTLLDKAEAWSVLARAVAWRDDQTDAALRADYASPAGSAPSDSRLIAATEEPVRIVRELTPPEDDVPSFLLDLRADDGTTPAYAATLSASFTLEESESADDGAPTQRVPGDEREGVLHVWLDSVHHHGSLIEVEGLGRALSCAAYHAHRPKPVRYVWHHILPQICGGLTAAPNLVSVCDNCHYGIHAAMYDMAHGRKPQGTTEQAALAKLGYDAAVTAGTVDKIPNEGGVSIS